MKIREDLKYSTDHEWVRVEDDKVYVGITDYAQDSLGDVVFLELSEEGEELAIGDPFGVVESVKAASDVYAPVEGIIVEINEELMDEPEKINEEPYDSWFIALEAEDLSEVDSLMDWEAYKAFCAEEA